MNRYLKVLGVVIGLGLCGTAFAQAPDMDAFKAHLSSASNQWICQKDAEAYQLAIRTTDALGAQYYRILEDYRNSHGINCSTQDLLIGGVQGEQLAKTLNQERMQDDLDAIAEAQAAAAQQAAQAQQQQAARAQAESLRRGYYAVPEVGMTCIPMRNGLYYCE